MPPSSVNVAGRLTAPSTLLAMALVAAAGLIFMPREYGDAMQGAVGEALRPAQQGMLHLRVWTAGQLGRAKAHLDVAAELAESERKRRWLEDENRRLVAELAAEKIRPDDTSEHAAGDADPPLLRARCVRARVLGHQARSFLVDHQILDAGTRDGVRPDALVVRTAEGLIDQGQVAGVEAEHLVLCRGCVWGKIIAAGPHTSTVQTVHEAGFRDLVRLATPTTGDGPVGPGPEGILEGTGEPLARVRLVDATSPVEVGDAVYTAAGQGILPRPLLYGHVVRLERPVGAAYWEIWMEPAVAAGEPQQVAVLRAELNPARVASNKPNDLK